MTKEDLERLNKICEANGFEIGFKYDESTVTVRNKPSKIKIDLDYRSVTHSKGNNPEYCELIFTFDSVIGVEKSRELYKVISEHMEK